MSSDGRLFPWPARSATGIGSMPGTDPAEAMTVIMGELPDLPHLTELPARGPGADLTGRTASLLIDMPVQVTPHGWQLAARGGRDLHQAQGMLEADLDAMEATTAGFEGVFKIQICGPWTLTATLELARSLQPALSDPGAVTDLVTSLAEGVAAHVGEVRRRLRGAATLLVQVDEPALPAVLAGSFPTASGLDRVAAVDTSVASDHLAAVLAAAQAPTVVHCCAQDIPFSFITRTAPTAVAFDLSLVRRKDEDAIGEAVESGLGLFVGAVPTAPMSSQPGQPPEPTAAVPEAGSADSVGSEQATRQTAVAVIELWRRIGLPLSQLTAQVVVTPACGLAGLTPGAARRVLARCRVAANLLPELIEEGVR